MKKVIPLVSSGTPCPLTGVLHLPRLWTKLSLEAAGLLAEGYPGCGKGYDQMLLDALGVDRDSVIEHVQDTRPSYPDFVDFMETEAGGCFDARSVQRFNAAVLGYAHDDATRKSILDAEQLDDESGIRDAVRLNLLDDLRGLDAQLNPPTEKAEDSSAAGAPEEKPTEVEATPVADTQTATENRVPALQPAAAAVDG